MKTVNTIALVKTAKELQKALGLEVSKKFHMSSDELQTLVARMQADLDKQIASSATKTVQTAEQKEIARMLIRLNEYRMLIQKRALTEWKGTAAELAAAITEAKRIHSEGVSSKPVTKADVEVAVAQLKKSTATDKYVKPVTRAKLEKKAKAAPEVVEGSVAAAVAKEIGISPKVARAKLRSEFGSDWKSMPIADVRKFLKS